MQPLALPVSQVLQRRQISACLSLQSPREMPSSKTANPMTLLCCYFCPRRRHAEVPAEAFFQVFEHLSRHPSKGQSLDVSELSVIRDSIREDVVHPHFTDVKAASIDQFFRTAPSVRSEEHTSELQSQFHL